MAVDRKTPPNIVLIMADQLAPQFTGAYGHPQVRTPHLDALAGDGKRFDAAYCNSPLCAPSRASFMSGQLISRISAYDNACEFPASIPTFAHYLRSMGYRTCLSGKMHFIGPDQLHGFEERLTTDVYPVDYTWIPDWDRPNERMDSWYHDMQTVRNSGMAAATFQIDYDEETAFQARRRIVDFARDRDGPFCLVASFTHPHDPYVARPEWWNLYDTAEIDLPALTFAPEDQDPFCRRIMDGIEASTVTLTEDEIRRARHAYFANVSYVDSKVGSLRQALEETGLAANTVLIVTADHGDMLGERGLWYKMNFFEHSARVPLVMAGPGIVSGSSTTVCSLVDILPTLIDIAASTGRDKPELGMPIDGQSLLPLLTGATDGEDDPVDGRDWPGDDYTGRSGESERQRMAIGEYCAEMAGHPVFMIRTGPWKYIHCDCDPPQLYHLPSDPEEQRNLAQSPDHAHVTAGFAADVARRWDSAALRRDVLASQRQRQAVRAAMRAGARTSWDHLPARDVGEEFVRDHMDWPVVAERTRLPLNGTPEKT